MSTLFSPIRRSTNAAKIISGTVRDITIQGANIKFKVRVAKDVHMYWPNMFAVEEEFIISANTQLFFKTKRSGVVVGAAADVVIGDNIIKEFRDLG